MNAIAVPRPKKPLTISLEDGIGSAEVRDAIRAQACGSYSSSSDYARWFCVETPPGEEHRAFVELSKQQFRTYLPLFVRRSGEMPTRTSGVQIIDAKYFAPKKKPTIRPVFPRYLFVHFDPQTDRWRPIVSTRGVRYLMSYSPERPMPVPFGIVEALQAQGRAGDGVIDAFVGSMPPINRGLIGKITQGPFADVHGICTWSSAKRVRLLIESMDGKQQEVNVPRAHVEIVEP